MNFHLLFLLTVLSTTIRQYHGEECFFDLSHILKHSTLVIKAELQQPLTFNDRRAVDATILCVLKGRPRQTTSSITVSGFNDPKRCTYFEGTGPLILLMYEMDDGNSYGLLPIGTQPAGQDDVEGWIRFLLRLAPEECLGATTTSSSPTTESLLSTALPPTTLPATTLPPAASPPTTRPPTTRPPTTRPPKTHSPTAHSPTTRPFTTRPPTTVPPTTLPSDPDSCMCELNVVIPDQLPWHATLWKETADSPKLLCSAAMVGTNLYVTSARCVQGYKPSDLQLVKDLGCKKSIYRIIIHSKFETDKTYDIALLQPFHVSTVCSDKIRPICLAEKKMEIKRHLLIVSIGGDSHVVEGKVRCKKGGVGVSTCTLEGRSDFPTNSNITFSLAGELLPGGNWVLVGIEKERQGQNVLFSRIRRPKVHKWISHHLASLIPPFPVTSHSHAVAPQITDRVENIKLLTPQRPVEIPKNTQSVSGSGEESASGSGVDGNYNKSSSEKGLTK